MSVTSPSRRRLLWLALASATLSLGLGRAAAASEITAPVEQLHAGLIAIMKAGKTVPFRQRYDMIAPLIGRTFDLEVILRQVIGPRWASLPPEQQAALGMPSDAIPSRPMSRISTVISANASRSSLPSGPSAAIGS